MIELVTWIHVISAAVLLGTGAGIAFFMLRAHLSRDTGVIAQVSASVVVADLLFTATAVVIQPISGLVLARLAGWPLESTWIMLSILLYLLVGACWLPVVWIQIRLRNLARTAAAEGRSLGAEYDRLFRWWVALGIPAFAGVLDIYWLMIARPS